MLFAGPPSGWTIITKKKKGFHSPLFGFLLPESVMRCGWRLLMVIGYLSYERSGPRDYKEDIAEVFGLGNEN